MGTIRKSRLLILAAAAFALNACQATGDLGEAAYTAGRTNTSSVSVDYYAIAGNSIQDLDTEIKAKGPRIARNRHAVAVARISMQPKMTYRSGGDGCSVGSANVAVNARVTLPAWTGRAKAGSALGAKWDNIDRYTRLHEAVHVAVAFRHARALEARLIALEAQPNCATARRIALDVSRKALKAHDRAQQDFDRHEQRRIATLRASSLNAEDSFGQPDVPRGLGLTRPRAPKNARLTKRRDARAGRGDT